MTGIVYDREHIKKRDIHVRRIDWGHCLGFLFVWVVFIMLGCGGRSANAQSQWRVINDTVMGGVSSSQVIEHESQGVVFSGTLSLENNGGFTSVRLPVEDVWPMASGIELTVIGDGRDYIATVRLSDRSLRRIYYRVSFETVAEQKQVIRLPFEMFEAFVYGSPVPSAPPLASMANQVQSIGVMLADGNPGSFSLHIVDLSPIQQTDQSFEARSEAVSVSSMFQVAIRDGVPLYNDGYADRCSDIYRTAIISALMLAPDQLSESQQRDLNEVLIVASQLPDSQSRAWSLRNAMDAIIMSR